MKLCHWNYASLHNYYVYTVQHVTVFCVFLLFVFGLIMLTQWQILFIHKFFINCEAWWTWKSEFSGHELNFSFWLFLFFWEEEKERWIYHSIKQIKVYFIGTRIILRLAYLEQRIFCCFEFNSEQESLYFSSYPLNWVRKCCFYKSFWWNFYFPICEF